ncbi:MAG: hypothetical protein LUC38_09065 [Oscillospiraceae bacterium]|nr:hypothetical protein [Oscillospiraceae bacterium]
MKMRKLLAVVLAVTMAISAMALSVFADTYEIPLYNYTTTDTYTATYTWTAPAYALYGVATQGDELILTLPTSLAADVSGGTVKTTYYALTNTDGSITTITEATYNEGNYTTNDYDELYEAVLSDEGEPLYYELKDASAANYDITTLGTGLSGDLTDTGASTHMIDICTLTDDIITALSTDGAYVSITLTTAEVTDDEGNSEEAQMALYLNTYAIDDGSGSNWWCSSTTVYATSDGTTQTLVIDDLSDLDVTNATGATLGLNLNASNAEGTALSNVTVKVYVPETTASSGKLSVAEYDAKTVSHNIYDELGYKEYTTTETSTGTIVPIADLPISYTLSVNGVTVNLQGTEDYQAAYGSYVQNESGNWVFQTAYPNLSNEFSVYTQVVEISTFARDYSNHNGTLYNATVPQSTLVSDSTPITITATVDYSSLVEAYGYDCASDVLAQSWEFAAAWWPSWNGSSTGYHYQEDGTIETYVNSSGETVNKVITEYGYSVSVVYNDYNDGPVGTVYAASGLTHSGPNTGSSSEDDVVVLIKDVYDSAVSIPLVWDHTLTNRGIILSAYNTEGATAQVVVDLDGSINGFAIYTLKTVANALTSDVWSSDAYWYTAATSNSALNVSKASTYTLAGTSTSQLVFDLDLSTLYDETYGLYNSYMTITQMITAADNSSVNYYYTNSDDNSLEATAVTLVITMPDDDATLDVEDPVEPGDTDTEDEGSEDLTVNEPADVEPETNPTTGIVLALVPMAVAAAAAVASKRR